MNAYRTLLSAAGRRLALVLAPILLLACDQPVVGDEQVIVDVSDPEGRDLAAPPDGGDVDICDDPGLGDAADCDQSTRDALVTVCYCGIYNGSPLYVGVHCQGYPSVHVCCAEKCATLIGVLNGQL